jgi:hypothetical protein
VHPPLGKMIIGGVGYITGTNEEIFKKYSVLFNGILILSFQYIHTLFY